MTILVIAEKPSVAKDIAKVLQCTKRSNGYFYNEKYIISWAIGHLVTLKEPDEYNKEFKKWKMEMLPIMPEVIKTKPIKNTLAQFEMLKYLMDLESVTELICATDSGREGELIFRYIYELTKCKKPFKRLWISSMTNEAIKKGFQNLKDGKEYDNLYLCAKCRSEADWLVGINATRVFSIKFNALLSVGRVQTPTLSIIVNRYLEVQNFICENYFEINVIFNTSNKEEYKGLYINEKGISKINEKDKQKADEIIKMIKGESGKITKIQNEEKKIPPPLLYDLTELQRECNRKYGYSAQKTLSLAQDLYEKRKLITYPRTDSRYLSTDMKNSLKFIMQKLECIEIYEPFIKEINGLKTTKRIIDDTKITDHHAIIPTNSKLNINGLSIDEKNVFDLIARRFIAVFYPPYITSTTKIITSIVNYDFITKGTTIIDKGFTVLNIVFEKSKKEEILPNVQKEEIVQNKLAKIINKKTSPPALYNEATLLSTMENAGRLVDNEEIKESLKESGLGTPATRASIIERLIEVSYITRQKKSLVPTQKGINLIEIVPEHLKSPETTGRWEKGLTSIAKGNMEYDKFMQSIKKYVDFIIEYAKKNKTNIVFENKNYDKFKKSSRYKAMAKFGKCTLCNGDILENSKSFYCSNWNNGCKFSIWKNALERYNIFLHGQYIEELLKTNKIDNIEYKDKDGNNKIGTITLSGFIVKFQNN